MLRTHYNGRSRVAWAVATVVLAGLLAVGVVARSRSLPESGPVPHLNAGEEAFRRTPVAVVIDPRPVLELSAQHRDFVTRLIRPPVRGKASNSFCLHWLRVNGLQAGNPAAPSPFRSGGEVTSLLLNSTAGLSYFGASPVVKTREGFRFLLQNETTNVSFSAESHRDHCLAALGELGVPSDSPVTVGDEVLSLADALRDSVANFHLGQAEIEWTALAYTLYLPPRKAWRNRFGEQYTFDALAGELLDRPLGQGSCAGTHVLYAVAILARVDREFDLLSPPVRGRVRAWLERCLSEAIRTQAANGTWSWDWHRRLTAEVSPQFRWPPPPTSLVHHVAVTGHMLECLLRLPSPLHPPDEMLRKSAEWLWDHLRVVEPQMVEEHFCPYTHAVCVLRDVSSTAQGARPAVGEGR